MNFYNSINLISKSLLYMEMEVKEKRLQLKTLPILLKLIMHNLLFTLLFIHTKVSHLRIKAENKEIMFSEGEVKQVETRSEGPLLSKSRASRER